MRSRKPGEGMKTWKGTRSETKEEMESGERERKKGKSYSRLANVNYGEVVDGLINIDRP